METPITRNVFISLSELKTDLAIIPDYPVTFKIEVYDSSGPGEDNGYRIIGTISFSLNDVLTAQETVMNKSDKDQYEKPCFIIDKQISLSSGISSKTFHHKDILGSNEQNWRLCAEKANRQDFFYLYDKYTNNTLEKVRLQRTTLGLLKTGVQKLKTGVQTFMGKSAGKTRFRKNKKKQKRHTKKARKSRKHK